MVLIEPLMLKYLIPAKIRFYFKLVLWAEWRWKPLIFWFDFKSSRTGVERLCSAAQPWHCSLISMELHPPCWVHSAKPGGETWPGQSSEWKKASKCSGHRDCSVFHLDKSVWGSKTPLQGPCHSEFGFWARATISAEPCSGWRVGSSHKGSGQLLRKDSWIWEGEISSLISSGHGFSKWLRNG